MVEKQITFFNMCRAFSLTISSTTTTKKNGVQNDSIPSARKKEINPCLKCMFYYPIDPNHYCNKFLSGELRGSIKTSGRNPVWERLARLQYFLCVHFRHYLQSFSSSITIKHI